MNGKICRSCKVFKTTDLLKKDSRYGDNYSSFCKECHKQHSINWQKRNPEKVREARLKRYHKNKEKIRLKRKEKYDTLRVRWLNIKRLYKLSKEDYYILMEKQQNKCAICEISAEQYNKFLVVDHDHKCCNKTPTCGKCTRGLLCHPCNLNLYKAEQNNWLKNARKVFK